MKKIISFMTLVLLLFGFTLVKVEASSDLERIDGKNRVETSIAISKKAYKRSNVVILAGYYGQVDSLSGTILAHAKNAPMIYAGKRKDKLDNSVLEHIKELGAKEIYILGGESVVSKEVEDSLSDYKVTRIHGKRREETAVNIAKEVKGHSIREVFLTLGKDNYADALAIGPVSGKHRVPIFLTNTGELPNYTRDALKELDVRKVTIIGGEVVINRSVEKDLKNMNIEVERVEGANRVETAINIAKEYNNNSNGFVLANGWEFADAVVGGYLACKENASILLTKDKLIDIKNLDYIANNKRKSYILGGEKVIYKSIYEDMDFILNKNMTIKEIATDFIEPFKTIKKDDPNLAKGKQVIKQKGVNGIRRAIDRVYYRSGKEQKRRQNIINNIVRKPIDKIVLIGSKK